MVDSRSDEPQSTISAAAPRHGEMVGMVIPAVRIERDEDLGRHVVDDPTNGSLDLEHVHVRQGARVVVPLAESWKPRSTGGSMPRRSQGTRRELRVPTHAVNRLGGRPPFAPLAFAAAAFAFERLRPPRRPVEAANRRVPNARSTSPGT